jgi:Gas vesicle synthesis protein GvpL/GvpF
METTMNNITSLYLYGIVRHPAELPQCDAIEDGTAVDVIPAGGIACVVSPVRAADYAPAATGRTAAEQLEWVTPRAWRHHEVVSRLHTATTVIPLKFGTLCTGEDDVRAMLERCSEPIGALLNRLRGRDEWTLSIRIDSDCVTGRFERDDGELRELCAAERSLPEGRAYFVRKKRQQRAASLIAAEFAATTDHVHSRIAGVVDGCCDNGRAAPAATLLVDRARFGDLTDCLAALEAEHAANALALELRGPWAPYSFVNEHLIAGN